VSTGESVRRVLAQGRRDILSVAGQNVEHVLVEPFELVAHREAKILQFLRYKRVGLVSLFEDPSSGPNSGRLGAGSHVECVRKVQLSAGGWARRGTGSRVPGEGQVSCELAKHVVSKQFSRV
jgi:hypothetical protein